MPLEVLLGAYVVSLVVIPVFGFITQERVESKADTIGFSYAAWGAVVSFIAILFRFNGPESMRDNSEVYLLLGVFGYLLLGALIMIAPRVAESLRFWRNQLRPRSRDIDLSYLNRN